MKKIYFLIIVFWFGTFYAQDNCATATPITSAGTFTISTINGTELPQTMCNYTNASTTAAEWYAYTPTSNYTVTVSSDLIENICYHINYIANYSIFLKYIITILTSEK
jgi:uncharacterized protein YaiE (UPF0345 family)